jgi:tetratricopeptide (TPR) repeat protein
MNATPPAPGAGDRLARLLALLESEPGDAFCLYGVAQEHARAGRHEEALAWYDRSLAADPDSGYAYFHKARSLEELDRVADACAALRAGAEAARRSGDSHALAEIRGYLDQLE